MGTEGHIALGKFVPSFSFPPEWLSIAHRAIESGSYLIYIKTSIAHRSHLSKCHRTHASVIRNLVELNSVVLKICYNL